MRYKLIVDVRGYEHWLQKVILKLWNTLLNFLSDLTKYCYITWSLASGYFWMSQLSLPCCSLCLQTGITSQHLLLGSSKFYWLWRLSELNLHSIHLPKQTVLLPADNEQRSEQITENPDSLRILKHLWEASLAECYINSFTNIWKCYFFLLICIILTKLMVLTISYLTP